VRTVDDLDSWESSADESYVDEDEKQLDAPIHRREDETFEQARVRNWKRLRQHRETKTVVRTNTCERCKKANTTPMLHPSMKASGMNVCFQCLIQEFVEPVQEIVEPEPERIFSKKRKPNPVHSENECKRFKPNFRPLEIPSMHVTEEVEQASSNLTDLPPSRHIGISYNKCSKQYVASYQLNRENRYVASGRDYDEVLRVLRQDHAKHATLGHRVTAKIGTLRKPFATVKQDKRQLKSQLPQSPYIGVSWSRRAKGGKWHAAVNRKHVGYYDSQFEAALAVNARCKELGVSLKNPQLEMSGTQKRPRKRWITGF